MADRVDARLFAKLLKAAGVGERRMQQMIATRAATKKLTRRLAAIDLATDYRINVSAHATSEDLAQLRHAGTLAPTRAVAMNDGEKTPDRPRKGTSSRAPEKSKGIKAKKFRTVYVVHGRDKAVYDSLKVFLRAVGIQVLEWNSAIGLSQKGAPYVGDVLDVIFKKTAAIIVLMTPDDIGMLRPALHGIHEPREETQLTGQPRLNVVFEAGRASGSHPDRTVLVQVGHVRSFSNIAGRHIVKLDDSQERRWELLSKLSAIGLDVDTSGTDWMSAGLFSPTPDKRGKRK